MKQVSKKEEDFIKGLKLTPLLLYVINDDLSTIKWSKFVPKWGECHRNGYKEIIIRDKKNLFLIKASEKISSIYLISINDKDENLPRKKEVEYLLDFLDIKKIVAWSNEWVFLNLLGLNLDKKITEWTREGEHIVIIKRRLLNMQFSEEETENILSSHSLYANTDLLIATYPHRRSLVDLSTLKKFSKDI